MRATTEKNTTAVYSGEEDTQRNLPFKYQLVFVSPEALLGDERWQEVIMNVVGLHELLIQLIT